MTEKEPTRVLKKARLLFTSALVESPIVLDEGLLGDPIPIENDLREIVGWFVPITVRNKITGYYHFDHNLDLLRYSTFLRNPEVLADAPTTRSFLDKEIISQKASTLLEQGESLMTPYLSFDGNVSKLVWAVEAVKDDGSSRVIFVISDYVYKKEHKQNVTG
jgi:hypothetical protein